MSSTSAAVERATAGTAKAAALRDYLRKHRGGIDALVAAARADRIHAVMRPYLEALA